ncbi:hypothetical protein NQD34_006387 [Periophthalmus magnuspinnatus]|nr:hypothetical protein NQD34_006387 [Periophthalmus magnuspinnatus]
MAKLHHYHILILIKAPRLMIRAITRQTRKNPKKGSSTSNQPQQDQNVKEANAKLTQVKEEKQLPPSQPIVKDETNMNQSASDDGTNVASEDTQTVNEKTTAILKGNSEKQSKEGDQTQNQSKGSRVDEKSKKAQGNTPPSPTHNTAPEVTQPNPDQGTKSNNQDNRTNMKNAKKTNESDFNQQKLDQNANEQPSKKQTKETKQQENKKEKDPSQTGKTQQRMVFGPQAEIQSSGSNRDQPTTTLQPMEVQPSEGPNTRKKRNIDDTAPSEAASGPQKPKNNETVDVHDRLVICFHAVLSKDFKFDPKKDAIFIQAGKCIGSWDENIVELHPTSDLGEHGFLVEGEFVTNKSKAAYVSIPYKYVVYKSKKSKYEYEYIYKLDNPDILTNRCLFVKDKLLNYDGAWHQYDDIICMEPEKGWMNYVKEKVFSHKRDLIQGREIAGRIMLATIFDLLKDWSDVNLKNFLVQLNQFFEVYDANPFVYEKKQVKWDSLGFSKEDVKKMLKNFMLYKMIPQLLKNQEGKGLYVQDPLRASVIMLSVCNQYGILLDDGEVSRLCTTLSLPKLNPEDFVKYWDQFSHDATIFPNLTEMLMSLMNVAKTRHSPHWILVLPLVHLLKGVSKPYDAVISSNSTNGLSWAGLEGIQKH